MANTRQAMKYIRASQRRRMRNKPARTEARHAVRQANEAIEDAVESGEWDGVDGVMQTAVRALDLAAQKGVVHANAAARRKSRLLRRYHTAREPEAERRPRIRRPEPAQIP